MTPVANCCGTMGSQKYFISERINVKLMMLTWNFAQDKEEFTPFVTQNLFGELRPRSPPKRIAQQIVERNALALDDLDTIIFRQIYEGLGDFAVFTLPGGHKACLQADVPAAKDTLKRIKAFEDAYGAKVCLAHDATWMLNGSTDETLISFVAEDVREAFRSALSVGETQ
ncbi:hypothetical protein LTR99_006978 [Exophiala xenobiotica]|nr:hypothetical protein LTR92_006795 [Exophiala xenobiotica]KAK5539499.1 hypothetical protein LTR23_006519 [Chaetothyriales sp. CCFEE 6169]KAK5221200.1 hypothetical protein LTR72_006760 [Exophiala xenobiotica]KAK5269544.1 hypothetical protein LTR96_005240 [Exophiala xenobiotica]KAK5280630.1 hypothetical protein LTR40_006083 [Exophiala xenobiotica]